MGKPQLFVQSYFLATQEKTLGRHLATGKILFNDLTDSFFFYLIEITPETAFDTVIERIIVDTMESFSDTSAVNEASFEKVLTKINAGLGELADSSQSHWADHLNAIVGVVDGDNILISQCGKIIGYIFRKNRISSLTDNSKVTATAHSVFDEIMAGQIATNDRIVFGTSEFFAHISLDRTRKLGTDRSLLEDLYSIQKYFQRQRSATANAIFFEIDCLPDEVETRTLFLDEPEISSTDIFWAKAKPILTKIAKNIALASAFLCKYIAIGSKKSHGFIKKSISPKLSHYTGEITESIKKKLPKIDYSERFSPQRAFNPTGIRVKGANYSPRTSKKNFLTYALFYFSLLGLLFEKKNRKYLYATLIALAIIIAFCKITINNSERGKIADQADQTLAYEKALTLYNSGKQDIALGKTTGKDQLSQALSQAEEAQKNKDYAEKSTALIKSINQVFDKQIVATRVYTDNANISLPADTVFAISVGNDIYSISKNNHIFSGSANNYTPTEIKNFPISSPQISAITYSGYLNKIFFHADAKMFTMDVSSKSFSELMISDATSLWETATTFASYRSSLYLMDSNSKTIFKHVADNANYSKGQVYLTAAKNTLANAIDIAIDGDVYLLYKDGSVNKYRQSTLLSEFKLRNIPSPDSAISGASKIFTDEDTNNIFVMDKAKNRVIVFDKTGNYQKQYILDNTDLTGFTVNPKLQKIWLLSGNRLFEAGL